MMQILMPTTMQLWPRRSAIRWLTGAALALALIAPASAQYAAGGPPGSGGGGSLPMPGMDIGGPKVEDPATVEKRKEIERRYHDATQRIPVQAAVTNDPWANMRGADETKPAKPAAKTTAKPAPKKNSAAQ
jgi:hypothetical protein